MNTELEVAAELVHGGMVVKQAEGEANHKDMHGTCANCQSSVSAKFCSNCGQSIHVHRSIMHLGEELVHGLLHFDAKGWRTLPMLVFRPGQLTRRYIEGQRVRFVSPLGLFLFMVFLMFFTFSMTNTRVQSGKKSIAETEKVALAENKLTEKLAQKKTKLDEAESELRKASKSQGNIDLANERVKEARSELATAENALSIARSKPHGISMDGAISFSEKDGLKANTGIPAIDQAAKHAIENLDLTKYKLKNGFSKYSFLLVPISLPFVWLMFFWRRDVTMFDHAVFVLYSLCFMALLMSSAAIIAKVSGTVAVLLVSCAVPVHMYKQLRHAYTLSRYGALWRTCALLLVAVLVMALYAVAVLALSVS